MNTIKIPFYQERSFGEKFNVTFEFVKQNWKTLLRYLTYVCLPLSLVGALSLNQLLSSALDMQEARSEDWGLIMSFFISYAGIVLVGCLGALWGATVTFSLMQVYNQRANGLDGITYADLKPYFKRNAWRMFKLGLVGMLLAVVYVTVMVLVGMLNWIFAFFFFIGLVVLLVPLLLAGPVYIYEDVSVWNALGRGIRLGWNTWGGIFGFIFILSVLLSVVQAVLGIPWQVCNVIKMFLGDSSNPTPDSIGVGLMLAMYVSGVFLLYTQFVISTISFVGTSYLYSHAAEMLDDMSVEEGIEQFEQIADTNQDADDLFS